MISYGKTRCLSPDDLLKNVELDVQILYNSDQSHVKIAYIEKSYVYNNAYMTIKLIRKWGGDPACDGMGFYGSAEVIANSHFYNDVSLMDLNNVIHKPCYCSMMGRYPKIEDIKYTHITNEDLCLLVLNGFLHDDSHFKFLVKDVIVAILKRVM